MVFGWEGLLRVLGVLGPVVVVYEEIPEVCLFHGFVLVTFFHFFVYFVPDVFSDVTVPADGVVAGFSIGFVGLVGADT